MAKYTTEVKSIVESINEENNFSPIATDIIQIIDERIEDARAKIFSFNYPINPADKPRFECNFIRHFYTREIGLETFALWKLKLADKLNLIIPKYNKLWNEAQKYADYDLLTNVDYSIVREYIGAKLANGIENTNATRTDNLTQTDIGTNTRTDNLKQKTTGADTDTTDRDLVRAYSDTPQGNMENLLDERYLTNLTHEYENGSQVVRNKNTEVNNTGTQQDSINRTKRNTGTVGDVSKKDKTDKVDDTINETVRHKGKDGGITFAEAIIKARETYLNIDLMLCNELNDLFMMIW